MSAPGIDKWVDSNGTSLPHYYQAYPKIIDFDVKDYAAVGDGTADDTAAIQAAITAASVSGGVVVVPVGIYKITSTLTVTSPNVSFRGQGWDQSTTTAGSILKAGSAVTDIINGSSAASKLTMVDMSFDGNALATNCVTVDGLNCQFTRCYARRPANNGVGFNVTSNGTSAWFTDCRFNGANQTGCIGYAIAGTDSTLVGCKAVNCLDSIQYLSGSSGAIMQACHWTPGSTIGRCCVNISGNGSNIQIIGNRIDNHASGSGIQVTPSSNVVGIQIVGNLFYQNVITDATFAAIGLDTTSAHLYQTNICDNIVRSAASHNYKAMLTAQTLAGSAATNPTRISSDGTIVSGNSVYAAALFGANSTPLVARGNAVSTDGTAWSAATDV